ncbi:MAG: hypothetical protein U0790_27730 [Isosphaeraceae bacterium]
MANASAVSASRPPWRLNRAKTFQSVSSAVASPSPSKSSRIRPKRRGSLTSAAVIPARVASTFASSSTQVWSRALAFAPSIG